MVKRRDLLTVTVDRHKSASMEVPKRLNVGRHFTIGGWHHHEDSRAKHVSEILYYLPIKPDTTEVARIHPQAARALGVGFMQPLAVKLALSSAHEMSQ